MFTSRLTAIWATTLALVKFPCIKSRLHCLTSGADASPFITVHFTRPSPPEYQVVFPQGETKLKSVALTTPRKVMRIARKRTGFMFLKENE